MLFPQQPWNDLDLRLITSCGLRVSTTKWANGSMKRGWPSIVERLQLRQGDIVAVSTACGDSSGGTGGAADAIPCLIARKLAPLQGACALAAATVAACPLKSCLEGDVRGWPLEAVAPETVAAAVAYRRTAAKADKSGTPAASGGTLARASHSARPAAGDTPAPHAAKRPRTGWAADATSEPPPVIAAAMQPCASLHGTATARNDHPQIMVKLPAVSKAASPASPHRSSRQTAPQPAAGHDSGAEAPPPQPPAKAAPAADAVSAPAETAVAQSGQAAATAQQQPPMSTPRPEASPPAASVPLGPVSAARAPQPGPEAAAGGAGTTPGDSEAATARGSMHLTAAWQQQEPLAYDPVTVALAVRTLKRLHLPRRLCR